MEMRRQHKIVNGQTDKVAKDKQQHHYYQRHWKQTLKENGSSSESHNRIEGKSN
jgi:hypothetical protein